uniref:Acyltransferase n=1 Tax=Chromochloris zofingiensis TaxID=31302 RepID=A0A411PNG2_9CHLO|nr:diacylglycerol acyltransferase [Chromochloris zofingiensis]|eukprot:jgi/Chrzof1/5333/Cz15g22140.t1_DGAT2E[v5.2]
MGPISSAFRQFLPEPFPSRPYRPPSEYKKTLNVRLYADGMDKHYQPNWLTKSISAVTLGIYIGWVHILGIMLLFSWYRPMAVAFILSVGTLLLPPKPLLWRKALDSYLFLCWRRYFHFSYVFEQDLDAYKDYVIAQFPHGAFPLGQLLGGTFMATEFPEYKVYCLAASSAFLVPLWRHVHGWLGARPATKNNFHKLLALGAGGPLQRHSNKQGNLQLSRRRDSLLDDTSSESGSIRSRRNSSDSTSSSKGSNSELTALCSKSLSMSDDGTAPTTPTAAAAVDVVRRPGVGVGVMVGGIAEMFLQRPDREQIKLRERKGFVRISLEHGADILPVYIFGNSAALDFGPPWLQRMSRKLRASIGVMYGVAGLPVPRRVPIMMAVGAPVQVGPRLSRDHPDFEARVDEIHTKVVSEIERVYYTHRSKYGQGWEDRPLVIT